MVAELARLGAPFVVGDTAHLLRLAVAAEIVVKTLDRAAVGAEIVVAAVEQHILAQRALQRTVQHRYLQRRLQADIVEVLGVRPDDPGVPAREVAFQVVADATEHLGHVLLLQTVVVRRIHHQTSLLGIVGPVGHGLHFHRHHVVHLRVLDVLAGYGHGLGVDVAAHDLEIEGAFSRVVVIESLEQLGVEVRPLLESESLAVDAGIDVGGYQCGFNQERARAAHGVGEIGLAAPAGGHDDAGGQHLVDGSLGLFLAVTALRQRFAAGVKADGDAVAVDVHVEQQVVAGHAVGGTLPLQVAEMVDDAVLDAIGHEAAVVEVLAVHRRVDGERGPGSHIFFPGDVAHYVVKLVGIVGGEFLNGLEDSQGCAQAQVGAIHQFQVSLEADHTGAHLYVFGPQAQQFVAQYRLQSLEGLGHH